LVLQETIVATNGYGLSIWPNPGTPGLSVGIASIMEITSYLIVCLQVVKYIKVPRKSEYAKEKKHIYNNYC